MIKYFGHQMNIYVPNRFSTWHLSDNLDTYNKYLKNNSVSKWTDDWGYKFNSYGFRSDELDEQATKRIYVIGCSYTLGEGLPFEKTWSQQFKKLYCEKFPNEKVNLLNFAQSGGSNDYISRMIIAQMNDIKPDLAIVQFSYMNRAEMLKKDYCRTFGPWDGEDDIKAYYYLYNKYNALIEMIKHMLQVQQYCELNNINYIFSVVDWDYFNNTKLFENETVKKYYSLLNTDKILDRSIESHDIKCDYGRDLSHPGIESNRKFAEYAFNYFERLYE
jgi:hypothetical protein